MLWCGDAGPHIGEWIAVVQRRKNSLREWIGDGIERSDVVQCCLHFGGTNSFHGSIAVALNITRQEENTVTAAQDRLRAKRVSKTDTRAKIQPVGFLLVRRIAFPDPGESTGKLRQASRGAKRVGRSGVEIGQAIVFFAVADSYIPTEPKVDGETATDFPIVLHLGGIIEALRGNRIDRIDESAGSIAKQERSESITAGAAGLDRVRTLRKLASERKCA